MTTIVRFNEDDLRKLVARELQVPEEILTSVYTEEMCGYGPGEHTTPIFYIEYEKRENKNERN